MQLYFALLLLLRTCRYSNTTLKTSMRYPLTARFLVSSRAQEKACKASAGPGQGSELRLQLEAPASGCTACNGIQTHRIPETFVLLQQVLEAGILIPATMLKTRDFWCDLKGSRPWIVCFDTPAQLINNSSLV
jgi:hypothetical protein